MQVQAYFLYFTIMLLHTVAARSEYIMVDCVQMSGIPPDPGFRLSPGPWHTPSLFSFQPTRTLMETTTDVEEQVLYHYS